VTLGTPIGLRVANKDQRPHDYSETDLYPRPSHADWSYLLKYGVKASSGGGRSSARETIGRVAAGAIAEKYLRLAYGVEIVAFVSSVGKVHMPYLAPPSNDKGDEDADDVEEHLTEEYMHLLNTVTRADVDATLAAQALPAPLGSVSVTLPGLGSDSVLLGAAEVAFGPLFVDPVAALGAALVDVRTSLAAG